MKQIVRYVREQPTKLMNKSFYQFVFSFVAVVAGVLMLILVVGALGGAVQ